MLVANQWAEETIEIQGRQERDTGRKEMCNQACISFGISHLNSSDVTGKRVIEVGSCDINGSLRHWVESLTPDIYVGVDIRRGPGVDEVCDATQLVQRFGRASFDLVISTELLEHVRDWRGVISNIKQILRPGGGLILTTRSPGFPYHGFPADFWRYTEEDMIEIFGDMTIRTVMSDQTAPGVFLKATKPFVYNEAALDHVQLFSILRKKRCSDLGVASAWWLGRLRPRIARIYRSVVRKRPG